MFVKKDEEKECSADFSMKELASELSFQIAAVVEGIGDDANLLAYDLFTDAGEMADGIAQGVKSFLKDHHSIMGSIHIHSRITKIRSSEPISGLKAGVFRLLALIANFRD